jgi:hypothetical protein
MWADIFCDTASASHLIATTSIHPTRRGGTAFACVDEKRDDIAYLNVRD